MYHYNECLLNRADVETVSFKSKKFVLNLDGSGKVLT